MTLKTVVRFACSLIVCSTLLSQRVVLANTTLIDADNQVVKDLTISDVKSLMTTGPRLIVMWSLECPACFDELDSISRLLKQHPRLPITLISTDDESSRRSEVNEVYFEAAFNNVPRWVYASGKKFKLQHAIDSEWQGELPRSFYIDKQGQQHGFSGLLTDKQLSGIVSLINK